MMAEQDVLIGRRVIQTVIVFVRRHHTRDVEAQYLVGNIQAVETVSDQIDAYYGDLIQIVLMDSRRCRQI